MKASVVRAHGTQAFSTFREIVTAHQKEFNKQNSLSPTQVRKENSRNRISCRCWLGVLDAVCGARTHVLLAASLQHSPETMRLFAEAARGRGFEGRILPAGEQHPSYASEEVRILHLSRRQHPR